MPRTSSTTTSSDSISIREFHNMLVLAKWALGIFDRASFEPISLALKAPRLEGVDGETGHTRFFNALVGNNLFYLGEDAKCTKDELSAYDLRIVKYWKQITERRNKLESTTYNLKYYQYLTLLVTELYLDWYFNRRQELLTQINAEIAKYNEDASHKEKLSLVSEEDLNKISFWEATGAGKTLMMDINVLQYRFYAKTTPDHTILLTPDEGLTKQHLKELELSNIEAQIIRDDNVLFTQSGNVVGVIDAGKIISDESKRKKGEKSFLAEAFEGKNLVLVDEGHNGSSSVQGERRRVREQLCKDGFSFEYSATFGQAVAKASGKGGTALREHYARNILFDYSYKYFYEDGYGKNSFILNMPDASDEERVFEYLCANLLKFVQQHAIFIHESAVMAEFNIEKPLCMFVGNTVTGGEDEASDVKTVVEFFARVLNEREKVEKLFNRFINNEPVLPNRQGFNLLDQAFTPMFGWYGNGKSCYNAMLQLVMHTTSSQRLKVTHYKNPDEIVLSVGTNEPFAVVNIGNSDGFMKGLDNSENLDIMPANDFAPSLFDGVNDKTSPVNFIIGSRKFTQGWSCWRVSAMGLLNMGVSAGTQIIQLFGRGVRLKGRGYSLKRSTANERPRNSFLEKLETLNIFGIRASYMETFRDYLNEEGVTTEDSVITLKFDIKKQSFPRLTVVEVGDGYRLNQAKGYKTQKATLFVIPDEIAKKIKQPCFVYEDYSYLQSLQKGTSDKIGTTDVRSDVKLDSKAFNFIDWDGIYLRMLEAKAEKGFWNLSIDKKRLIEFVTNKTDWYTLYSRPADITFDSFSKLSRIQALLEILLRGYMDVFYKTLQKLYEDEHMVTKTLKAEDLPSEYEIQIQETPEGKVWLERLKELQKLIAEGEFKPTHKSQWLESDLKAIFFDRHLYEPLFYTTKGVQLPLRLRPIMFDSPSEVQFLKDLETFYNDGKNKEFFLDVDLFLMRNPANKSRGIGFAQAGNFYPDFLLWLVDKNADKQYLTFIDPKGLRNIPFDDSKLNFSKECKTLQKQLNAGGENKIILNSVILSITPLSDPLLSQHKLEEWEKKNIFFMSQPDYLSKMIVVLKKE